jgi:uroporphyrinogen-III synthase
MGQHKVLSTRKLLPSLIEEAAKNDIEVREEEFIAIRPILTKEKQEEVLTWILAAENQNVLFTSSNAVEAVKTFLRATGNKTISNRNAFCLSGKTKESLLSITNPSATLAMAENAEGLANEIKNRDVKEIVFFCSNKRRNELPDILSAHGIRVHEVVVYETFEKPSLASDGIDGILFFSPSAVSSFFSLNNIKPGVICFAIGKTTAEAISEFTRNKIIISGYPSQQAMLDLVIRTYKPLV